ncbi:MAG TPA: hypothetical protein VGQ52_14235 [Gemmatimonadaceae bacterium]|nr:hypothetical protein [Gemmatimonadaceae bacterium]
MSDSREAISGAVIGERRMSSTMRRFVPSGDLVRFSLDVMKD